MELCPGRDRRGLSGGVIHPLPWLYMGKLRPSKGEWGREGPGHPLAGWLKETRSPQTPGQQLSSTPPSHPHTSVFQEATPFAISFWKKKKKSTEYSINIKFLFHNFQTHRGTLEEKKKKMTTTTKKKPGFDFFWKTAHRSEFNLGLSEILTGHIMVSVFLQ